MDENDAKAPTASLVAISAPHAPHASDALAKEIMQVIAEIQVEICVAHGMAAATVLLGAAKGDAFMREEALDIFTEG